MSNLGTEAPLAVVIFVAVAAIIVLAIGFSGGAFIAAAARRKDEA